MLQRIAFGLILLVGTLALPARADQRWIVRSRGGLLSVQKACNLITCGLIRFLGDPQSQLFLITTPDNLSIGNLVFSLLNGLGIINIEVDAPISLLQAPDQITQLPSSLSSGVWNGYANQPAANIVRVAQAQQTFGVEGAGIVAVIDTGVDPNHPALKPVLVPGYDFLTNQPGMAPETPDAGVSQSTAAVVDGSPTTNSQVAVLSQSTAAVVDGDGAFGHGTMVAGIVHLVAPRASIMPLKAFGANGQGYESDILRALYWAVNAHAHVINMSFSMPQYSREMETALDYADKQNVISVAAAGNNSSSTVLYPAGYSEVMGVGSTNWMDQRSSFSNFGRDVWVAAPGENIVSTYPGATYATGSGTSFSTPFVSGAAALLVDQNGNIDESSASRAISHAKPIGQSLGNGRLDIYNALGAKSYP